MQSRKYFLLLGLVVTGIFSFRFCGASKKESQKLDKTEESLFFLKEWWRNPKSVGALFPSSKCLARAMTRPLSRVLRSGIFKGQIRVLEAGPGTGAFTEVILTILKKHCKGSFIFDAVEFNPKFCKKLEKRFEGEPVRIHNASIADWSPDYDYHFIISGLPFNSLGYPIVDGALSNYEKLIKPGGVVSYFEYYCGATILKNWYHFVCLLSKIFPYLDEEHRCGTFEEFVRVRNRVDSFARNRKSHMDRALFNIFPARAIHVFF